MSNPNNKLYSLNAGHLATILAGLRTWQGVLAGKVAFKDRAEYEAICEIAGDGLDQASPDDIDDICEGLNGGDLVADIVLDALVSAESSFEQLVKINRIPGSNKGLSDVRRALAAVCGEIDTVLIRDLDHWTAFADANKDALLEIYPDLDAAKKAACEGGIELGGGAMPLTHIRFADGAA